MAQLDLWYQYCFVLSIQIPISKQVNGHPDDEMDVPACESVRLQKDYIIIFLLTIFDNPTN